MPDVTLKGRITPDHRVEPDAPEDWPQGEVEVVVRRPSQPSLSRLKETLSRIGGGIASGRSRSEIDAYLATFRDDREDRYCENRDA